MSLAAVQPSKGHFIRFFSVPSEELPGPMPCKHLQGPVNLEQMVRRSLLLASIGPT
jgi:hypothetical protein